MKGSDKRFLANQQFYIIQYNDKKVSMMKGKYAFRARTFQDAFERFGDLIKPLMMKDTDAEFGLIGNKKLLASTSVFNDNLEQTKVEITGDEYKTDKVAQMMIGLGLREKVLEWGDDMKLEGREYWMIWWSAEDKNVSMKAIGSNYGNAKKSFDKEMKLDKGNYGVVFDWNYNFKYWSSDYNLAMTAISKWFISKGYYLGIVMDEEKAGFEMEWQVQEKVEAKIKQITGQFSGDGSVFATQQYFYIWKWSMNKVTFEKRGTFWKMGDAYAWYINYVTYYLKRDPNAELLLVGSNTPMLSTASWSSETNKIMMGKAIAEGSISMKSWYQGQMQQYWMLLMNKESKAFEIKALGASQAKAYSAFGEKTAGGKA
jgi:hypothetical protein